MPDPRLELRNISVAVAGRDYVRDVSLTVSEGRFLGLLGANGAGKTTLLRVLYSSVRPSGGEIVLDGRPKPDWRWTDWARSVGALVQGEGLLAGLTPADIVEIGLNPLPLEASEKATRRDAALDFVGLSDKRDQNAENLSGGERQRCYFAQLLARDPQVYVLDEPTNHLDLHFQLRLLDEVRRRGRIVIASLHDLTIANRYCDTVAVMEEGRIVAQGPPESVLSRAQIAQTYRVDAALRDGALHIGGPILGEAYVSNAL
ncbi:MAG: iron ABC transporter [Rhodobacterales bacterium]|nr:MAG: iron ABC transporter [Rhodobacterales bacterium]